MRRFEVERLANIGASQQLSAAASHHLVRVLRLSQGDMVQLFDGSGSQVHARIESIEGDNVLVEVVSEPVRRAPQTACHLVLGLPKKAALDTSLRMATELGVTHIHPFFAKRSVPSKGNESRWKRIVSSAAQQCGRADMPGVSPPAKLTDVLGQLPDGLQGRVLVPGAPRLAPSEGPIALVIGPEGGLTPDEVRICEQHGFTPMGLGEWVLRVDTAVAAGLAAAK